MRMLLSGWTAALWLVVGAATLALGQTELPQVADPTTEVFFTEGMADCNSGCDVNPECCLANWHVSASVVILDRSSPGGGTTFAFNPGLAPMASSRDFDFGWNAGLDLALTRRLANGNSLQFRYFGIDSSAANTFVTPGNFIGGGFIGPGGTTIAGRYATSLDSTEFNWRHVWTERVTWLAGFRWIELKDDLNYNVGPVARGQYEYNNHMYGGQIGLDCLVIDGAGPWEINAIGKVGLFANVADGGIFSYSPAPIGGFQTTETLTSFVGELGITGTYHVTEQFAIRAGYELLFLGNLGLGSDAAAASLTNPALLAANVYSGDLFYHGVTVGVEYAW
jgi:hypothetical protein